jgi:predicted metal-binding membrane protein
MSAWAVLIATNVGGLGTKTADAHRHHMDGIGTSILLGTAHWQLMVLAMMLPVVVPSLRAAAFRSLWRRRHRAVAGFLVGYLTVWALVGLAVCCILAWAPKLTHEWQREAAAGAFLLAACWHWSRIKQRALVACHRTIPLAPSGLRADRDCIVFGWQIGCACCLSCWVLMVACTLTGHSSVALLVCGLIGLAERYSWRPNTKLISFGILGQALAFGLLGFN